MLLESRLLDHVKWFCSYTEGLKELSVCKIFPLFFEAINIWMMSIWRRILLKN